MMMSTDERQKILNKINKCLKLSKSSEPHEAAAALRQAQKMMAAHSVSEGEILGVEVQSLQIITPEAYKRKLPMYMSYLCAVIIKSFDVHVLIECGWVNGKPRLAIRYFGQQGKPDLAVYAHEVMFRQLRAAWAQYSKDNPWVNNERGARAGFWVGWLQEVQAKVDAFAGNSEEKEIVKKAMAAYAGGSLKSGKTNNMSIDGQTHNAGRAAAGDFSIHRPMNGQRQRQLR